MPPKSRYLPLRSQVFIVNALSGIISQPYRAIPLIEAAMRFGSQSFLLRELRDSPFSTDGNNVKTIWFDQPYHLYLEELQARTYLKMISRETFVSALHAPAESLMFKYRKELLSDLHEPVEFYDLGPGLPKKTLPLLRELKAQRKRFTYIPVDISRSFLRITKKAVSDLNISTKELNCLFEDLPDKIPKHAKGTRLFLVGLTFNNYRPDKILALLNRLSGPKDINIIITQFFADRRKERILSPYKDHYAEQFNFLTLKIIGIPRTRLKYFAEFRNQRIEMGFKLIEDCEVGDLLLEADTRIVTAISYRYRKQDLMKKISDFFDHYEIFQDRNQGPAPLVSFKLHKHENV